MAGERLPNHTPDEEPLSKQIPDDLAAKRPIRDDIKAGISILSAVVGVELSRDGAEQGRPIEHFFGIGLAALGGYNAAVPAAEMARARKVLRHVREELWKEGK
jgi:hypothetical protein